MRFSIHFVILCGAIASCAPDAPEIADLGNQSQAIYYGTREPQNVELSEGQMLAIGWFYSQGTPNEAWCTGTLISPRIVVSAEHCFDPRRRISAIGFGVGRDVNNPRATFSFSEVHPHSYLDAALFVLEQDATDLVPDLVPIQINRHDPSRWLNQPLDASGYGETHDRSTGRYFASVWLEDVEATQVTVNGRGEQGICFGDSGGPLLAPGPVVVAVESYGESSCVGRDIMKRLDYLADWIDSTLGDDSPVDNDGCGDLDYLGRCNGSVAEWCEDNTVQHFDCATEGMTCGYVDDSIGYFCVESVNGGSNGDGENPNDDPSDDDTDNCFGIDYLGRCDGDIAQWCEDGQLFSLNCRAEGKVCRYIDDEIGYYCVEPDFEDSPEDTGDIDDDAHSGCQCQSSKSSQSILPFALLFGYIALLSRHQGSVSYRLRLRQAHS